MKKNKLLRLKLRVYAKFVPLEIEPVRMENKNNQSNSSTEQHPLVMEIPVEGSLGILAYGYQGLKAWRKKKREVLEEMKKGAKK